MSSAVPTNAEIADRLSLFAALLELAETNPFAVRAYSRAADLVRASPTPVSELVRTGRVRQLRGIGPGIESKLRELVETGEIAELRTLERELEPALVAYGRLHGIDAKRMRSIVRALGVRSVGELEEAVSSGRLQEVPGIGPVTEGRIREALSRGAAASSRGLTLDRSRRLARTIAEDLGGVVAGETRRACELTYELAIVCAAEDPEPVFARFEQLDVIVAVLERDERSALGLTLEGVPVRVAVAVSSAFGTALLRETGSAEYVAALEPLPEAADEPAVFGALGIPYCPPELRELPGTQVPQGLVEIAHLRGDLHCHTTWSDGKATAREMATAARERAYEYLAICDHTPNVGVVPGLDADALRRQGEEIDAVNEELAPFRVLRGVECDIRGDGTLDVADDVLRELDWVQLSLHAGQRRPRSELTKIVVEAMQHPSVRALSHPKGRILNRRPENALDLDTVFDAALRAGVALEVNGRPDRLDLSAVHVREALAAGVELVLNSDAHSAGALASVELAVATARKGGTTAGSVVNCRPLSQVVPSPRAS